jgi:hypothetical protein
VKRGCFVWLTLCCCALPAVARGQTAYVSASGGVSAGDGGASPAIAVSAGYLTPKRIGFEVEFGFVADLDFPGPDVSILATSFPGTSIFPPIMFESSGDLFTFHTNVVFPLTSSGKLRVQAIAGGGAANVRIHTRFIRGSIILEGLPEFLPPFPVLPTESTVSDAALSLNLGGFIEYALTERLGAGVDARYNHVFLEREGLDFARITGRMSWRF